MKKVYRYILPLLFCFLLTSCSLTDEIKALYDELDEIAQFFSPPMSDEAAPQAETASADGECAPILTYTRRTELIESPYNPKIDAGAVSSVGSTDKLQIMGGGSGMSGFGYTFIKAPDDRKYSSFERAFADAGITVEAVYKANPAPVGEVFAIEYAGFSDSDGYYVNPAPEVLLYVSDKKPAVTASEGDNLVYITFDDGPSGKNTPRLLEALDTYGVKAAFFTTGEAIQKYPDTAMSIVERGHTLGCHSVTHDYKKIYASVAALEDEVIGWERIVEDAGISLGSIGTLTFRFPGGSIGSYFDSETADEMKQMLEERGYFIYDWNVVTNDSILYMAPDGTRSYDYIQKTFAETLELCLRENKDKSGAPIIILMHETVDETAELLPWLLEYLCSEGYTFGNLAELGHSWTFADR